MARQVDAPRRSGPVPCPVQGRSVVAEEEAECLCDPVFVWLQILVATIAFLLPSAEHSSVEADKKVCECVCR